MIRRCQRVLYSGIYAPIARVCNMISTSTEWTLVITVIPTTARVGRHRPRFETTAMLLWSRTARVAAHTSDAGVQAQLLGCTACLGAGMSGCLAAMILRQPRIDPRSLRCRDLCRSTLCTSSACELSVQRLKHMLDSKMNTTYEFVVRHISQTETEGGADSLIKVLCPGTNIPLQW